MKSTGIRSWGLLAHILKILIGSLCKSSVGGLLAHILKISTGNAYRSGLGVSQLTDEEYCTLEAGHINHEAHHINDAQHVHRRSHLWWLWLLNETIHHASIFIFTFGHSKLELWSTSIEVLIGYGVVANNGSTCSGSGVDCHTYQAIIYVANAKWDLQISLLIVFAVEIDPWLQKVLLKTHPELLHLFGDVSIFLQEEARCLKTHEMVRIASLKIHALQSGFSCVDIALTNQNRMHFADCLALEPQSLEKTSQTRTTFVQGVKTPVAILHPGIVIIENSAELMRHNRDASARMHVPHSDHVADFFKDCKLNRAEILFVWNLFHIWNVYENVNMWIVRNIRTTYDRVCIIYLSCRISFCRIVVFIVCSRFALLSHILWYHVHCMFTSQSMFTWANPRSVRSPILQFQEQGMVFESSAECTSHYIIPQTRGRWWASAVPAFDTEAGNTEWRNEMTWCCNVIWRSLFKLP